MATLAIPKTFGNFTAYEAGVGVNANDVVVQTGDVSAYDSYSLMTTAGAVQVLASLDGTNYATAPLAMKDMGATTAAGGVEVIVTAANRIYTFKGNFRNLQVTQNGVTAATAVTLVCSKTHVAG